MPFPLDVLVEVDPNPAAELIEQYHFSIDGVRVASSPTPSAHVPVTTAGSHTFGVAAQNAVTPLTAEVTTTLEIPSPASTPTGLKVTLALTFGG